MLYEFEVEMYVGRKAVNRFIIWADDMAQAKKMAEGTIPSLLAASDYPLDTVTIHRLKESFDVPHDLWKKFENYKRAHAINHGILLPMILGDDIMGYDFALFDYRGQQLIFASSRFESVQAFTCTALGIWQRNGLNQFYPTKHIHPDFVCHQWHSFV